MKDIIEEIERKISIEKSPNLSIEQKCYLSGMADALEIVKSHYNRLLVPGKNYFVLTHQGTDIQIENMTLYRITQKKKVSYTFTRDYSNPTPDLILYGKYGIQLRVFNDYQSAEKGIPFFLSHLTKERF